MHPLIRALAAIFALVWVAAPASAASPEAAPAKPLPASLQLAQNLPASGNNDPYSNPIRRANPNSMQGTQPANPSLHSPNTAPAKPAPTLENGGIGNGYPRGGVQRPNPDPRLPSPSYDANGNRR
ncbi:hypothetical protein J4P02_00780 [Pseudomonas sp. NFXW11]|uniref:hypothetical protein n=1 Tax=Pseudomonas sp. NFXW11 TaxID=2819531 RepID=UPI003CF1EA72